jgi:hypothetical protein
MGQESPPGPEEDLGGQSEASMISTSKADDRVYAFLVRLMKGVPGSISHFVTLLKVEECILHAFDGKNAKCPKHGDLYLGQVSTILCTEMK